jgi:hypothetical protein
MLEHSFYHARLEAGGLLCLPVQPGLLPHVALLRGGEFVAVIGSFIIVVVLSFTYSSRAPGGSAVFVLVLVCPIPERQTRKNLHSFHIFSTSFPHNCPLPSLARDKPIWYPGTQPGQPGDYASVDERFE